jgi:hypothetical protein
MRITIVSILLCLLLSACTTYKPEGVGGGYTLVPLGQQQYRIDVRGNSFAGMQTVRNIAMVKAADTAIHNGFKYFRIIDSGSSVDRKLSSYDGNIYSTKNHYFSLIVELTNDEKDINADQTINDLGPSVGYKKD